MPPPTADRWVVVDTETSGLDPERDRLLAIGGVAVDGCGHPASADSFEIVLRGEPIGRRGEHRRPRHRPRRAGARACRRAEALAAYRDWVAGAPLRRLPRRFRPRGAAQRAAPRADVDAPDAPWLDLAPLAGALVPEAYRYGGRSLDDWLAAFGIECTIRHNAAADALATAELLLRLRALAAQAGHARLRRRWCKVARSSRSGSPRGD